jgi:hypothetical protein
LLVPGRTISKSSQFHALSRSRRLEVAQKQPRFELATYRTMKFQKELEEEFLPLEKHSGVFDDILLRRVRQWQKELKEKGSKAGESKKSQP